MIRSLSVLLPVYNVQSSLWASVHETLEVLAELTGRFELVIVDDGSTDGTWDVARELAQLFPQVRLLREPLRRHVGESLSSSLSLRAEGRDSKCVSERRTHVHNAQGDVVIAHDGRSEIDAQEIVRLWRSLLTATPAPKFLTAAAHRATIGRSLSQRSRNGRKGAGFSILRPSAIDEQRRAVAASGVR